MAGVPGNAEAVAQVDLLSDLVIDRSVPIPPYFQIREALRRHIHDGALPPGERLPTVQELAKACDVSPVTVTRAFGDLAREGLLISRTRAGTTVADAVTPSVELLVPFHRGCSVTGHDFIQSMLLEIDRQFGTGSRRAFLSYVDHSATSAQELLALYRVKRVDGLIVYRPAGAIVGELRTVAREMPVVALFYPVPDAKADCVRVDPTAALHAVLRQHLEAGARHLAFLGERRVITSEAGGKLASPYAMFYRAFKSFAAEAGVESVVRLSDVRWPDTVDDLLRDPLPLPEGTVLVGTTPETAVRIEERLGRRFHKIGYTEYAATVRRFPDVHTLFASAPLCARRGVALLRERLHDPAAEPRTVVMEPDIVEAGAADAVMDHEWVAPTHH